MTTKIPSVDFQDRDMSVNPRKLRRAGRIPATIYGHNIPSISVDLDQKTFTYLYYHQNMNLLVLEKEGEKSRVLLKNVQIDPISMDILNVEFLKVNEDETVTLSVPLVLEGESPAVKSGGILLQIMDEIQIECLPRNIPDQVVFDISVLEEVDSSVSIRDIVYPEGVKPILPEDTAIVKINAPKFEAAEETEDIEGADVELVSATATSEEEA